MSHALLKQAKNTILSDKNRKRAEKVAKSEQLAKIATVAGGALAALYDHNKGSEDGAEPAKLFAKDGQGGFNANIVVGTVGVAASFFKQVPGRNFVGSLGAGMLAAGVYRHMMESYEKHS
jgi:hypothetical protein